LDDEQKFNPPPLPPPTKAAIAAARARLTELNSRPIKKVSEALARKKHRAIQRFEKMKKKAEGLIGDTDLSEKARAEGIVKLMKKAKSSVGKKKETKVVVAKGVHRGVSGRPKGVKGRYKMVDKRMKKEVRAEKRAAKSTKGKRRK